jgi:hypothetical protein
VSVLPDGDFQSWMHLSSANLSLGGMFVINDGEPVLCGTRVSLALEASGRLLDFAQAEVVHCAPTGFGVRFIHLRPRARALVEHLVARGGTGGPVGKRRRRKTTLPFAALALGLGGAALLGAHTRAPQLAATAAVMAPIAPPPAKVLEPPAPPPVVKPVEAPRTLEVAVPTGAVSSLRIRVRGEDIAVEPLLHRGVLVQRVFTLASPPRLVIDVSGREPRYSWQLDGTLFKSVRVGARNHGTRVVVDLDEKQKVRVVTPAGV